MATQAFEEIVEDFEFLDNWEDRYMHVIDLGKSMSPLEEEHQVEANKVQGCASQVWLISERNREGRLVFRGASDAHIVSGLVAIATQVFSDRTKNRRCSDTVGQRDGRRPEAPIQRCVRNRIKRRRFAQHSHISEQPGFDRATGRCFDGRSFH